MKIGYCRVSTTAQNIDSQVDALRKEGCEKIYEDKGVSGSKESRPGLDQALDQLRPGDSLVVWRLDRLGRSLSHLLRMVGDFKKNGVHLVSIHERIDTSTAMGNLVFQLSGALAEFERNLIKERSDAGREAARRRGRVAGRKQTIPDSKIRTAMHLMATTSRPLSEICADLAISVPRYYERRRKLLALDEQKNNPGEQ